MIRDTQTGKLVSPGGERPNKWARRRDIPLAILAWVALISFALWAAWHIVRSLVLLAIAALLAFALAPAVKIFQRWLPRVLAIMLVYIVVLGALSVFVYLIISTAISQTITLSAQLRFLLTPGPNGQSAPLEQFLAQFGISGGQLQDIRQQALTRVEAAAQDALPIFQRIVESVFDIIVVAILSIYLLLDGSRAATWLRNNSPRIAQANFLLDTFQQVVGGYIRGQLLLASLIGILVGVGMFAFQLPYAIFLGVLAFAMAFIPVLGTFISGAVCVLIALGARGWVFALIILGYFIVVHIIEGDVIGPRIVGKAVGLHPVVSLFALLAGAELFGIWGALFASPIAGVLQATAIAIWTDWRATHPEQFQRNPEEAALQIEKSLPPDPPETTT